MSSKIGRFAVLCLLFNICTCSEENGEAAVALDRSTEGILGAFGAFPHQLQRSVTENEMFRFRRKSTPSTKENGDDTLSQMEEGGLAVKKAETKTEVEIDQEEEEEEEERVPSFENANAYAEHERIKLDERWPQIPKLGIESLTLPVPVHMPDTATIVTYMDREVSVSVAFGGDNDSVMGCLIEAGYRIVEDVAIGSGAYGTVYSVVRHGIERELVAKVVKPSADINDEISRQNSAFVAGLAIPVEDAFKCTITDVEGGKRYFGFLVMAKLAETLRSRIEENYRIKKQVCVRDIEFDAHRLGHVHGCITEEELKELKQVASCAFVLRLLATDSHVENFMFRDGRLFKIDFGMSTHLATHLGDVPREEDLQTKILNSVLSPNALGLHQNGV